MNEQELRDLANELRSELSKPIDDNEERLRTIADIDRALGVPHGQAEDALRDVLRKRPETRRWIAARTGADDDDNERGMGGPPGLPGLTTAVGVHFVCPEGNYDRFAESPDEDPGFCPTDGHKLVRATD